MTERRQTPIRMWGSVPGDATALDWEWVEQRLVAAEEYWLITSGGRGPAPRPVWGIWNDDHLLLTVGSTTHWRNLAERSEVAVHLGDTHEVVVIEGTGTRADGALDPHLDGYNEKYDWNFETGKTGPVIRVDPRVVLAWTAGPTADARSNPFPLASGRWEF